MIQLKKNPDNMPDWFGISGARAEEMKQKLLELQAISKDEFFKYAMQSLRSDVEEPLDQVKFLEPYMALATNEQEQMYALYFGVSDIHDFIAAFNQAIIGVEKIIEEN